MDALLVCRPRRTPALTLALVLVTLAIGALTPRPAAAAGSAGCDSAGSRTVYGTSLGRVFTKRRTTSGQPRAYVAHYSCARRYGRRFLLAESDFAGEDEYGPFRFAGPFLAYAFFASCAACEERQGAIMVQSLRTGRHLHRAEAIEPLDTGDEVVTDLVVKRNASVAWIAIHEDPPSAGGTRTVEVNGQGTAGRVRLDAGPDVAPRSLTLSGATVSWSKGGRRASATLR